MKINIRLLLLGLVTFFVFLIATIPASVLSNLVSRNSGITFGQVSGSVWHGYAKRAGIATAQLGPVEWSLHAWRLLLGELSVSVKISRSPTSDNIEGSGRFSVRLPGVLIIRNAEFHADAERAFSMAAIPIVASGQLALKIEELNLRSGALPRVDAELIWQNAGVSYPQNYNLGSYLVQIQNETPDETERVLAKISDQNSPLHINGQAIVEQDGSYQLDINVSAESNAPQDITRVLPILGSVQEDGSVKIQRNGQLSELF